MLFEKNKNALLYFCLSLLLCLGGGWLTGLATQDGVKEWYPHLVKPKGTPPDIVFPIVWTCLYLLMAISLTLLVLSRTIDKTKAYFFFGVQLFLNFIWSWLFFRLQQPGMALVDLIVLWIMVCFTIVQFRRHTAFGSYLLLPYLAWITYAGYLNLFIWMYIVNLA
ncbi:MAG: TspO/MBR family protein [Parachlamydiaceae bacterium]